MSKKELRQIHLETLLELAQQHSDIMVLEADLMSCLSTQKFAQQYPERFLQCGIAEANMIGIAAGLSAIGKVPYVHSFGCFATRRCFDQLFISGGYAQQHINIFGSDAGVTAVTNGGTHMPFEDIGLMRLIPNSTVIDASDENVLKAALKFAYGHKGINYIRATRKATPKIYLSDNQIKIGKANILKDGNDVTFFACGICVYDALEAAKIIEAKLGLSIAVIDVHTIKPLDTEVVIKYAQKTKTIFTIENHNVTGGLGDSIATTLLEAGVIVNQFYRFGIREQFGQVGSLEYLKDIYQISTNQIVQKCMRFLAD